MLQTVQPSRRGVQRDAVHRAIGATKPVDGFESPVKDLYAN